MTQVDRQFTQGRDSWLRALRDIPEFRLLAGGLPLFLAWEILQSPFYADTYEASLATLAYNRIHCSVGDGMILLAVFWMVALLWGRSWMAGVSWMPLAVFLGLGVVYTAFSEYLNVYVRQSWSYSQWMPVLSGIGVVPLFQWVVIPSAAVRLARGSKQDEWKGGEGR